MSFSVFAEVIEIGRVGGTQSTGTYFSKISFENRDFRHAEKPELINKMRHSISQNTFFPLVPGELTPGIQAQVTFDEAKLMQPFAMVGVGKLSTDWLSLRYEKLTELGALVFVIEAETFSEIRSLAARFPNLRFAPSSGNIGAEIGIKHYPVLITGKGVYQ